MKASVFFRLYIDCYGGWSFPVLERVIPGPEVTGVKGGHDAPRPARYEILPRFG